MLAVLCSLKQGLITPRNRLLLLQYVDDLLVQHLCTTILPSRWMVHSPKSSFLFHLLLFLHFQSDYNPFLFPSNAAHGLIFVLPL